eukprot:Skav207304  [mRNA]  locus=scaffold533:117586:129745:+ [translate_table: standard]
MAFKLLLGLMMIGAASAETGLAEGAVPSKQNVSAAKETLEPTVNVSQRSNLQRCPCGVDCSRETTVDVFQRSNSGRQCPCRVDCENVGVFQRSNLQRCPCGVDCSRSTCGRQCPCRVDCENVGVFQRSNLQRCPCGVDCSRETTGDVFQRSNSGRQCPCRVDCENVGVFQRSSFLHCPCGIDCQKDMGKEHGFQLHQGCGCVSCNLRGATESKPAESVKAEDLLALLAEQEQDWDAASVPGDSQLTFCRCGSLGNSCRSCSPSSQSRSG